MPVEFSVAAYRLGHSMVRPGYRLNDNILLSIFPKPGANPSDGLTGFKAMNPHWGIDWARFVDTEIRPYGTEPPEGTPADEDTRRRLQFAYRIDTSIVNPLANLPKTVAGDPPPSPPLRAQASRYGVLLLLLPKEANDPKERLRATGEHPDWSLMPFAVGYRKNFELLGTSTSTLAIAWPLPVLMAAAASWPLISGLRARRRSRRHAQDRCLRCGYNLSATPTVPKCPECGTVWGGGRPGARAPRL
mgnify:CR=1 FL=1